MNAFLILFSGVFAAFLLQLRRFSFSFPFLLFQDLLDLIENAMLNKSPEALLQRAKYDKESKSGTVKAAEWRSLLLSHALVKGIVEFIVDHRRRVARRWSAPCMWSKGPLVAYVCRDHCRSRFQSSELATFKGKQTERL